MLLAIDFDEDFINKEGIAIARVRLGPPFFIVFIDWCRWNYRHPIANLSQQIFETPVAQIEAIAEPDGIADDICGARSCGGRLAGSCGVCLCLSPDCAICGI